MHYIHETRGLNAKVFFSTAKDFRFLELHGKVKVKQQRASSKQRQPKKWISNGARRKDRNIFLSSPLPKLFWHVVGRLHQVIGLLHAIPSLLAFFHMNLCCLVLRVDFISKISYFYISNHKSLLVFKGKYWKSRKNASILLPLNWNSSWLGWWILDFLRLWVRETLCLEFGWCKLF